MLFAALHEFAHGPTETSEDIHGAWKVAPDFTTTL